MYDILIKNAVVITVDSEHHVYNRGFVAVKGDSITALGPMEELEKRLAACGGEEEDAVAAENRIASRMIDAEGKAVMPGLIDGHGHGGHCLIRTLGDQLEPWDQMAEDIYFRQTDDFFLVRGSCPGCGGAGEVRHDHRRIHDRQHAPAGPAGDPAGTL